MNDRTPQPAAPPLQIDPRTHRVELAISFVLRTGVVLSLSIVALGTIISFVHHPSYLSSPPDLQRLTQPGAAFPYPLRDVAGGIARFEGRSIAVLGLLLLIATPVVRVAMAIGAFLLERDRFFAVTTAVVLLILLLSFVLGRVE